MLVLVIGGSGSGKSEYAERLALRLAGEHSKFYLATMQIWDDECRARVDKHRRQRAGRGFITIECPQNLVGLQEPMLDNSGTILLEDLGNLAANELYSPGSRYMTAQKAVLSGMDHIARCCKNLVIVSNEVGAGGTDYEEETVEYLRFLGNLHQQIAQCADAVCEVVGGIPYYYKGSECL